MYRDGLKRGIDSLLSLVGIIVLSPILSILCIAIKTDSKGPVISKQKQVGKNRSCFYIYEFRTMKIDTPQETPTHLLSNPDFFIIRAGKFLRKTSLNELPQLFNILKGDMAAIGPRPALWNQYDLVEGRDKYYASDTRPGLTGLAQISGRDELEVGCKACLDGQYTANITPMMDLKCFLGTTISVFKSDGAVEGRTGSVKREDAK